MVKLTPAQKLALFAAVLFILLQLNWTYRVVHELLSPILTPLGLSVVDDYDNPTWFGIALHSLVFILILYGVSLFEIFGGEIKIG